MTTIWVEWDQEGFHCWPEAEQRRYLANDHRHKFHFRFELQIFGLREVEFHDLLEICKQTLWMSYPRRSAFELDFEDRSCEFIADYLIRDVLTVLKEKEIHSERWAACEVSEDGECGARIERRPQLNQPL